MGSLLIVNGIITYRLKVKNYNDMKVPLTVPFYLFIVLLPESIENWLEQIDDGLILRKQTYFLRFERGEPSDNKHTVTVKIPVENRLSKETLVEIMNNAGQY